MRNNMEIFIVFLDNHFGLWDLKYIPDIEGTFCTSIAGCGTDNNTSLFATASTLFEKASLVDVTTESGTTKEEKPTGEIGSGSAYSFKVQSIIG